MTSSTRSTLRFMIYTMLLYMLCLYIASITPSVDHIISRSHHQSITSSVDHIISQSHHQSITPSVDHIISQSHHQSITSSVNHIISQSHHQSITSSVNHIISRSHIGIWCRWHWNTVHRGDGDTLVVIATDWNDGREFVTKECCQSSPHHGHHHKNKNGIIDRMKVSTMKP
jgi:hypothetical protein